MEIWKDIKDYEGYQVSNLGQVKSYWSNSGKITEKYRIRKQSTVRGGYKQVRLKKNGIFNFMYVHRLVAITFIPNTNNYETVDHLNRITNCNTVTNLRWANRKMQIENSNNPIGSRQGTAKLEEKDIFEIKKLYKKGLKGTEIAKLYQVHHSTISRVVNDKQWKHVKI